MTVRGAIRRVLEIDAKTPRFSVDPYMIAAYRTLAPFLARTLRDVTKCTATCFSRTPVTASGPSDTPVSITAECNCGAAGARKRLGTDTPPALAKRLELAEKVIEAVRGWGKAVGPENGAALAKMWDALAAYDGAE